MAESDRSRSPVPLRNRLEPRGQVPAPALPFFPRWCGPMSASVRHFQNMPRPQQRPNWSGNSSGPSMTGRMWSQPPPNPPSSWMSQQFPPLPPHNSLPPTLPYPPQPCPSTQPCPPTIPCPPTQPFSPGTPSISPPQPRSNATPKSNPPSRPGNDEATRTYGFDPNPHWQEDLDHYDNRKINGLTFPRSIRQSAFAQKLDVEGCDPLSLPLAAMMYQQANNHWLRKLAHGRELYLIPTGDITAVAFTTELLSQLRNRGIDLDRVSHFKARQDGKLLGKTANAKYAAQQIAELIQIWLPARTTDPDSQHEITRLRNQLVPRPPHKAIVDVTKRHACHAKYCGVAAEKPQQNEGRCHQVPRPPHKVTVNVTTCHPASPVPSATPATQSEGRCHQAPRPPYKVTVDVTKCPPDTRPRRHGGPAVTKRHQSQPSAISAISATPAIK